MPLVGVLVLFVLSCHPQPHRGWSTIDGLTQKWRVVSLPLWPYLTEALQKSLIPLRRRRSLPLSPWTCIAAYSESIIGTVSQSFFIYFSYLNLSGRFLMVKRTLINWFLTCSGTISQGLTRIMIQGTGTIYAEFSAFLLTWNAGQRDLMQGLNSCQNKDPEMGVSNSESLLTNQL